MAVDADSANYRIEHDTMGEVRVPAKALWRAQTQRAVENFPISGRGLERTQIRALGLLKGACAQVNSDLGLLAPEKADAIIAAAAEIADGQHDDQFPIDVFQTGSGTSSNMNTNEVIASIAAKGGVTLHPNDDVNMSQSSNDTFPTATHIAATEAAVAHLIPALQQLHDALAAKALDWHTVVKSGRTHLMDAVPVTLGQEFSGYAARSRPASSGCARVCPGWASWRSAAPRWVPASTLPTTSASEWSRCWSRRPVCRNCVRRLILSKLRLPATGWWRRPGRCARSRYR